MSNTDIKLPQKPIYQMLYDGRQTKKLIEMLIRLESDELGDIDLDNPELEAILQGLAHRISVLETSMNNLPDFTNMINMINQNKNSIVSIENKVNQDTNIINSIIENDLTDIVNRILSLENSSVGTEVDVIDTRLTTLEGIVSTLGSSGGDIESIPNDTVLSLFV